MTTLYETLGVDKGAAPEAVQAAYRKKAKKMHPDAGGKREDFEKLSLARDVLLDPQRRERYDHTGDVDEKIVDNDQATIINMVVGAIDQHLAQIEGRGADPLKFDLIALAKDTLRGNISQAETERIRFEKGLKTIKDIAARMHVKKSEQPNRLQPIFERRAFDVELRISQTKDRIRQMKAAFDILSAHEFEFDNQNVRHPWPADTWALINEMRAP